MRTCILILAALGVPTLTASAATIVVEADGTGDFPTIQAAVDAAESGDTIELGSGTFAGVGNRDILVEGKQIAIRSQAGPSACVIDCEGLEGSPARAFSLGSGASQGTSIEGITILGGFLAGATEFGGAVLVEGLGVDVRILDCVFSSNRATFSGGAVSVNRDARATIERCTFDRNEAVRGGALTVINGSAVSVVDCVFASNTALRGGAIFVSTTADLSLSATLLRGNGAGGTSAPDRNGGAIHVTNATLRVERCTLADNHASGSSGGGIYAQVSTFEIVGSTFWGNSAAQGGGLACGISGNGSVSNSILAGSTGGGAVSCGSIPVLIECTDIHGNAGGDWTGGIEGMAGLNGNISVDPRFCDPESGDFTLEAGSPCAPFSPPNPECDRIGVHLTSCGAQPVVRKSWGQIKHANR